MARPIWRNMCSGVYALRGMCLHGGVGMTHEHGGQLVLPKRFDLALKSNPLMLGVGRPCCYLRQACKAMDIPIAHERLRRL